MRTLTVANQKGGVGKTTLATHIAYAAEAAGKRVLMIDLDPQGSMTLTCNIASTEPGDLLASDLFVLPATEPPKLESLSVRRLPIGIDLIAADYTLYNHIGAGKDAILAARSRIRALDSLYDVCVIDTPPERNALLVTALAAADFVVTPMTVGLYEQGGIKNLFDSIRGVQDAFNPGLTHLGIVLMKTNARSAKEGAIIRDMRERYGAHVIDADLPERAAVRHAVNERKAVWTNPRGSSHEKAAAEWRTACNRILAEITQ